MYLKHETTHAEMEAKYGPAPISRFSKLRKFEFCSIRNNSGEKNRQG
jgi:hypothetical protein